MSCREENHSALSLRDKVLTSLGAAIASHCVPCIEYHVPRARKIGLTDAEIREAVLLADRVRRIPADKVLGTALALTTEEERPKGVEAEGGCGCSGGGARAGGSA